MATDIKNIKDIKNLLNKYYDGATSPEEERILADFFASGSDIPEDMEADRKMFEALGNASLYAAVPENLESKIMDAVDSSILASSKRKRAMRLRRLSWLAAAAAAAVVAAVIMLAPFRSGTSRDAGSAPGMPAIAHSTNTIPADTIAADTIGRRTIKAAASVMIAKSVSTANTDAIPADSIPPLTEAEQKAFEAGMKALARAGEQIAYASDCMETTDRELRDVYYSIQDKLK